MNKSLVGDGGIHWLARPNLYRLQEKAFEFHQERWFQRIRCVDLN